MITGEEVVAARKLVRWSQITLALEASVLQSTVMKFETGKGRPSELTVSNIKRTLENAGIEFRVGKPVRMRKR
jgi:transcriptional regulator with XRE-family HTH domain